MKVFESGGLTTNRLGRLLLAILLLGGGRLYGQILQNGSFELPVVSPNSYQYTTPTGWNWATATGAIFNGNVGTTNAWPLPEDGQQFADIGNNFHYPTALYQGFTIANGGQGVYQVTWFDNAAGIATSAPYSATVFNDASQVVGSVNYNSANSGVWEARTLAVTLSPGSYTLQFASGPGGYDTLLDNVSIAVPEPSALTWNNAGGTGDGITWDNAGNQNWNNGSGPAYYIDSSNVTFNDSNNGNFAVTLNTIVSPGSVTVNSTSNYIISGTGSIAGTSSLTKMGSSTLTLSTVNTYSGGTNVSAGTLVVGVQGALPNHGLTITGGEAQLAANTGLAQLTSLSISAGAALDITNNHMIISYTGSEATEDATIRGYLINGFNGGAWNGTGGINSSVAALPANSHYGIGYADGADGVVTGLSSGQIEIKYTLLGDADLDGSVTGSDFTILASNLGKSVSGWDQGDFNYDGVVSGSDFTALVANLGKSANGADVILPAADYTAIDAFAAANGLMADVPEPTSTVMMVMAGLSVLAKRLPRFA